MLKVLKFVFVFFLLVGISFSLWIFLISQDLPDPAQIESFRPKESTKIFDRNGNLLYEIYGEEKRTVIPLKEIPKEVILA
ncbi:MAG TPA: hypothetical protein ENG32_00795, partial [bacterium]|nr:hypothetical protein [bacterium]